MLGEICSRFGNFFENPKMFVWTRRMQFWQRCRKFFQKKGQTIFAQSPKIFIKLCFFHRKYFPSSKCSSGLQQICRRLQVKQRFLKYVCNSKNLNSIKISKGGEFAKDLFDSCAKIQKVLNFEKLKFSWSFFSKNYAFFL